MDKTKIVTEKLDADINKLKTNIEVLSMVRKNLLEETACLSSVWRGDAATGFFGVYFYDMERMENIIHELTLLTDWMSYASELYNAAQERAIEDIKELTF